MNRQRAFTLVESLVVIQNGGGSIIPQVAPPPKNSYKMSDKNINAAGAKRWHTENA